MMTLSERRHQIAEPPADTLERALCVHNVVSLGPSARRGPALWSHILDVRSRDRPSSLRFLMFPAFDRCLVMDMSTTQSYRNPWRPRHATPENAESARPGMAVRRTRV